MTDKNKDKTWQKRVYPCDVRPTKVKDRRWKAFGVKKTKTSSMRLPTIDVAQVLLVYILISRALSFRNLVFGMSVGGSFSAGVRLDSPSKGATS